MQAIQTFKAVRHGLYNARRDVIPRAPVAIEDIVIEGEWAEVNGERFLLFNNGGVDKIIGFATEGNLQKLVECSVW